MSAFRIFDDDDDGCIHPGDLVDVLTSFGERFSKSEARKLVQTAAKKEDGLIDYQGEPWKCFQPQKDGTSQEKEEEFQQPEG